MAETGKAGPNQQQQFPNFPDLVNCWARWLPTNSGLPPFFARWLHYLPWMPFIVVVLLSPGSVHLTNQRSSARQ